MNQWVHPCVNQCSVHNAAGSGFAMDRHLAVFIPEKILQLLDIVDSPAPWHHSPARSSSTSSRIHYLVALIHVNLAVDEFVVTVSY